MRAIERASPEGSVQRSEVAGLMALSKRGREGGGEESGQSHHWARQPYPTPVNEHRQRLFNH